MPHVLLYQQLGRFRCNRTTSFWLPRFQRHTGSSRSMVFMHSFMRVTYDDSCTHLLFFSAQIHGTQSQTPPSFIASILLIQFQSSRVINADGAKIAFEFCLP